MTVDTMPESIPYNKEPTYTMTINIKKFKGTLLLGR